MANHRQQQRPQNNLPAFVLGNGTSRQRLKLGNLKGKGVIYGCNALYREFEPDYLIAVDVKMINEIVSAGYHKTNSVWTNPNKGISDKSGLNFFTPHKGWSSGPTALWFSCLNGHSNIYFFGFDYQGLNGRFNNIYADTFNYKRSTDSATYFGNWLNQTEKTIKEYRTVQFYRVVDQETFVPDKLKAPLPNFNHISYEDFEKKFPDTIYSDETNQKTTI